MTRQLEDAWGETLTTLDMAQAFAGLEDEEAENAALLCCFLPAVRSQHPIAEQLAPMFGGAAPPPELLEQAESLLQQAIDRIRADLDSRGIDIYSPLDTEGSSE